jgi:hypothetical protein
MTEDQIERRVEAKMDRLDRALINGELTQSAYDDEVRFLDNWAGVALGDHSKFGESAIKIFPSLKRALLDIYTSTSEARRDQASNRLPFFLDFPARLISEV